ncbi:MAG: peptide deformylase, partial [Bacteroidales bacterium]|nr:peptide deformylase [Bacteroidales bacterium]
MEVPIILYGSPVLRRNSAEVTEEDNIQKFADDLFYTIKKAEGIGLAAPQINLLKRVFVIDTSPLINNDLNIERFEGMFINPEILEADSENKIYREGCLSLPDIYEEVTRPEKILVRYQDRQLKFHEEEFDGIKARIFQHEYDHLEGILFIDKISFLRRKLLTNKLNRIKKIAKHEI